jgi:hypothetical protein
MNRPRNSAFSALCLGVSLLAGVAFGSNLLRNASFENGFDRDLMDWAIADVDGLAREGDTAHGYTLGVGTFPDGLYAMKLFSRTAILSQGPVAVEAGAMYRLSAMFYHSSQKDQIAADELSLRGFLRVEWFAADGTRLREDFTENHNGRSVSDAWVPITQVFVAPDGAVKATVHVQTHGDIGGGSLFVDRVYFGVDR